MEILKKSIREKYSIISIIKYAFSVILTVLAYASVQSKYYLVAGLFELTIIFLVTDIIMNKTKKVGLIVNSLLLILYNAQMAVMFFANSYITIVMLENIPSLKGLSGKMGIYITAVLLVVVFSVLPVGQLKTEKLHKSSYYILVFVLCIEMGFGILYGTTYSPMYGYANLVIQYQQRMQLKKQIESASGDVHIFDDFYQNEVTDYREKDEELDEKPNIILIFTEGLSQHIIEDERMLMPNVYEYEQKSLSFDNYYNHTFATYCALISQLYSGYQLSNLDTNPLVSLQSIMGDEGYTTYFVNTEPNNEDFTGYLKTFQFDYIIGDTDSNCNGVEESMSDKDAYQLLYQSAMNQHELEEPFFMAIYTFGTHVSFDSPDEKFGDGQVAELNKFYNMDYQFGEFMKKFESSVLAEDTIIFFTSDHATYQDDSYTKSFQSKTRITTTLDETPFFIYYKGIEPENIDVSGRNSICLAPTILDYLDISSPNYFLGTSLFSESAASICETSYYDSNARYSSKEGNVGSLSTEDLRELDEIIHDYFVLKGCAQVGE